MQICYGLRVWILFSSEESLFIYEKYISCIILFSVVLIFLLLCLWLSLFASMILIWLIKNRDGFRWNFLWFWNCSVVWYFVHLHFVVKGTMRQMFFWTHKIRHGLLNKPSLLSSDHMFTPSRYRQNSPQSGLCCTLVANSILFFCSFHASNISGVFFILYKN